MSRVWQGLAMAIALAAMTAGGVVITQQGGGEAEAAAWVNTVTTGDTCTRSATPKTFEQAEAANELCDSFDAACDAAASGDLIRVKDGNYGDQTMTCSKTSETRLVGESQAGTVITGGEITGNWITLENMTIDSGSSHGWSWRAQGNDVTLRDVHAKGLYIGIISWSGDRFTWDGGVLGEEGVAGLRCTGDTEPIQLDSGSGHIIRDLTIWPQGGSNDPCGGDGFHEEDIRIQSDDTLIERVYFPNGDAVNRNAGSGKIFLSGTVTGLVIRNTVFGGAGAPNTAIQNNTTSCSVTLAYNTFIDDGDALTSCTVTRTHNLGPGSAASLGVSADGLLQAGSSAIDAAETDTGSDYCTGALGAVDRTGGLRPVGSACDTGADERD